MSGIRTELKLGCESSRSEGGSGGYEAREKEGAAEHGGLNKSEMMGCAVSTCTCTVWGRATASAFLFAGDATPPLMPVGCTQ